MILVMLRNCASTTQQINFHSPVESVRALAAGWVTDLSHELEHTLHGGVKIDLVGCRRAAAQHDQDHSQASMSRVCNIQLHSSLLVSGTLFAIWPHVHVAEWQHGSTQQNSTLPQLSYRLPLNLNIFFHSLFFLSPSFCDGLIWKKAWSQTTLVLFPGAYFHSFQH